MLIVISTYAHISMNIMGNHLAFWLFKDMAISCHGNYHGN